MSSNLPDLAIGVLVVFASACVFLWATACVAVWYDAKKYFTDDF